MYNKNTANPTRFLPGQAVTDTRLIEHLCQKVYFPTEPVTLGHITSVNGIMRLLLREFIITEHPLSKEHDLKALKAQAERNFDLGLETFETLTVPSFENVVVLTTAVSSKIFCLGSCYSCDCVGSQNSERE